MVSCVIFTSTCLVRSIKSGSRQASHSFYDVIHKSILPMETFFPGKSFGKCDLDYFGDYTKYSGGRGDGIAIHLLLF